MPEDPPPGHLSAWLSSAATIFAPASVLSALLFYFGYVSARAQYEYFGVDVDTIELSTQEYIMRSPQPLLVPLLVLMLAGAGLLIVHARIRERIATASIDRTRRIERAVLVVTVAGGTLLGGAVVLLLTYSLLPEWPPYSLVTPLLFTAGGGTIGYAYRVRRLLRSTHHESAGSDPAAPVVPDGVHLLRRAAVILIYTVVAASVFWSAATVAQWSGRGQAQDAARHLDRLPRVILDTRERLLLRSPGVEETVLPRSEGQSFRYRYRRLRLLIVGRNRMFLVPDAWSASNSTLVVPIGDSVRVQFQFQNQRP